MYFKQVTDIKMLDTVYSLYKNAMSEEGCTWNEHYPTKELIESDLRDGCLYGIFDNLTIAGLIVRDRDEDIDLLSVWNPRLKPAAELARLVVAPKYQNKGIARRLIEEMCREMRIQGFKSVHYLVANRNIRAVKSYAKLEFVNVGRLNLFDNEFSCYERDLTVVEEWDAYDEDYNLVPYKTLVRGEAIPEGLFHTVVEVLVKHTDGTYLCMQRDLKKNKGGLWETSAGGSVLKGESFIAAAMRELLEETGVDTGSFTEVGRAVNSQRNALFIEYVCVTDCDKNSIQLQKGETIDYKWMTAAEIHSRPVTDFATQRMFGNIN